MGSNVGRIAVVITFAISSKSIVILVMIGICYVLVASVGTEFWGDRWYRQGKTTKTLSSVDLNSIIGWQTKTPYKQPQQHTSKKEVVQVLICETSVWSDKVNKRRRLTSVFYPTTCGLLRNYQSLGRKVLGFAVEWSWWRQHCELLPTSKWCVYSDSREDKAQKAPPITPLTKNAMDVMMVR